MRSAAVLVPPDWTAAMCHNQQFVQTQGRKRRTEINRHKHYSGSMHLLAGTPCSNRWNITSSLKLSADLLVFLWSLWTCSTKISVTLTHNYQSICLAATRWQPWPDCNTHLEKWIQELCSYYLELLLNIITQPQVLELWVTKGNSVNRTTYRLWWKSQIDCHQAGIRISNCRAGWRGLCQSYF